MENARKEERTPVDVEIRFRYPEVFKGRMRDFCSGGMGAQIPVTVDIDSPVEVEIFEGRILASGHVRWVTIEEGNVRVGIQFREGDRDIIRQVRTWKGDIS